MKPITIIRHIECEGPGYLETVLQRSQVEYRLIAVDQQQPIPSSVDEISGLVIMGGPMSVNDNDEWIAQEKLLIRRAIDNNLPVLGHCLGGQFIAAALDADIVQNPVKEIGWLPVNAAAPDSTRPEWLDLFNQPQAVFHWHGETFELPDNCTRLLSSKDCINQAFLYKDNVFAFQCHIEMTADMVDEWSRLYEDELQEPSDTIQTRKQMLAASEQHIPNMQRLSDEIYQAWIARLQS